METTNTAEISIFAQNVNGLRTKSAMCFRNSSTYDHKFYALTETNLNGSLVSSEFFNNHFDVCRKDRCETGSQQERGGVLIASLFSFASNEIQIPNTRDIECICIQILINSTLDLFIVNSYIKPGASSEIYEKHRQAFRYVASIMRQSDVIVITGDFNIPGATWDFESTDSNILLPSNVQPVFAADFIEIVLTCGVYQVNRVLNENGRLLDLIFTNEIVNFDVNRAKPLVNCEGHHPPLLLTFEWHLEVNEQTRKISNFKKGDYVGLNRFLHAMNIEQLLLGNSVDGMVDVLCDILTDAIDKFIPKITIKRNRNCPWGTKELQRLKNLRNKEWKRFKLTGDVLPFETAFAAFDSLNTKLYDDFVRSMSENVQSNSKQFWQFVNSRRHTINNPKFLRYGNVSTCETKRQADLFADFFATTFKAASGINGVNDSLLDDNTPSIAEALHIDNLSLDEFFIFQELEAKKGAGPDGVHPLILRNCSALLYKPLWIIFNESLSLGRFPNR